MRKLILFKILIGFIAIGPRSDALPEVPFQPHQMVHNFVLAPHDGFASHLVASGPHSRQTEILGQLSIKNLSERDAYLKLKKISIGKSYFLFRAQKLELSTMKAGQILTGMIVESKLGIYDTSKVIVKNASYKIQKVLLNIDNPFFKDQ